MTYGETTCSDERTELIPASSGASSKFRKIDHQLPRVCLSVCPHGTTRLPLDGFSLCMIFGYFSKICPHPPQKKSSFVAHLPKLTGISHEAQCTHFLYISVSSSLSEKSFREETLEKIKTHILCSTAIFRKKKKRCLLWANVERCCTAGQATDENMAPAFAYWLPKATNTNSEYVTLIAFPLQQWWHERSSFLRYTYISSLVILSPHFR